MGNIDVDWEVEGIIKAPESVAGMLNVIEQRSFQDTGTFWTWEGQVKYRRSPKIMPKADKNKLATPVVKAINGLLI